ncbi:MAG: tetratricopeptide repeat protein, partial [Nitrospira sp.]
ESLVAEYLKVEPSSVPMLELLGELYQEKGDPVTAAQHFGKAVEILLENPEPGMPTLPAELFEKVQALAPGSAIARKLAPSFNLNPGAATSTTEPEPVEPMMVPAESVAPMPAGEMPFKLRDSSTVSAPIAPTPPPRPVVEPTPASTPPAAAPQAHVPPVSRVVSVEVSPAVVVPPADNVDAETRYALGMAYKDMGLLEEAKEEFLLSMKDSGFFVDSCLMMGLCVKEQGQSDHAVQLLEKLIADSRCRGGNAQLVRYELGLLYEKMGSRDRAIAMYQSIPSFHDVPRRLESLRNHSNGVAHPEFSASKPPTPVPLAGH